MVKRLHRKSTEITYQWTIAAAIWHFTSISFVGAFFCDFPLFIFFCCFGLTA